MSLSGPFKRYSRGPLYSQKELQQAEEFLAKDGYVFVSDCKTTGLRHYKGPSHDATIFLDQLGCAPGLSGSMAVDGKTTVVWEYVRQKRVAGATNAVSRFLIKAKLM